MHINQLFSGHSRNNKNFPKSDILSRPVGLRVLGLLMLILSLSDFLAIVSQDSCECCCVGNVSTAELPNDAVSRTRKYAHDQ